MPNWVTSRVFLRVARMSLMWITCLSDLRLWGFQSNSAAIHILVSPQHSNFRSVSYILEAWIIRGAYLACTVFVERDRVGPARVPAPVWLVAKEGDQGHAHVKDNGKFIEIATRVLTRGDVAVAASVKRYALVLIPALTLALMINLHIQKEGGDV